MGTTSARAAMIDAAERLFVEQGVGAVSLRDVQRAAGQRNKSAAHYHFGDREGLISAIVDARMGPVNARRNEMLDTLDARGDEPLSLRELVEALVEPLVEMTLGRSDSRYARFLVQIMFDPALVALINEHLQAGSVQEVCRRITDRLDHLPLTLRDQRVTRLVALVVVTLATWEGRQPSTLGTAALVGDLVDSCLGLLEAPLSQPTQHELRAAERGSA